MSRLSRFIPLYSVGLILSSPYLTEASFEYSYRKDMKCATTIYLVLISWSTWLVSVPTFVYIEHKEKLERKTWDKV